MTKRIAVVGGGIVGGSIAFHAAEAGAEVVLIERSAHGAGASGKSFGWINANDAEPRGYHLFRQEAIRAWRRLETRVDLPVRWGGSLSWELGDNALRAQADALRAAGFAAELIAPERAAALEPTVAAPPETALFCADEGAVDAGRAAAALAEAAAAHGAARLTGAEADRLISRAGRIVGVETSFGPVMADCVILAAGVGSATLAKSADIVVPMADKKGLIVRTRPLPPVVERVVLTPDVHFRQEPDGRIVAGEVFSGGGPHADLIESDPRALAAMIVERLRARLPRVEGIELGELTLGVRPFPRDGLPIVGEAVPGLYLAVMHSGVTLAPLIGELAAREAIPNETQDALAPYRLSRKSLA